MAAVAPELSARRPWSLDTPGVSLFHSENKGICMQRTKCTHLPAKEEASMCKEKTCSLPAETEGEEQQAPPGPTATST